MADKPLPPTTVEAYLAQTPKEVQPILEKLRTVIKAAAPDAEERIAYNMPAYYLDGFLVSFSAWKRHIGFYPRSAAMDAAVEGLSAYQGTQGSVHFPLDQPVPYDLVRKIVEFRLAENRGGK